MLFICVGYATHMGQNIFWYKIFLTHKCLMSTLNGTCHSGCTARGLQVWCIVDWNLYNATRLLTHESNNCYYYVAT